MTCRYQSFIVKKKLRAGSAELLKVVSFYFLLFFLCGAGTKLVLSSKQPILMFITYSSKMISLN